MTLPDLANVSELLALLGPGASEAKAQEALTQASRRFRGAVRHPVSFVEGDEVWLDGDGTSALLLPAAPVVAVTEVEVDGDLIDDYEWSPVGVLRRRRRWPDRLRSIRVVYDHGWVDVPEDIQEAVLHQARYMALASPGVSSMQVGGQTVSWSAAAASGVTETWATVVEAYRLNRGDDA